jgi:cystathionine gamma-lyase
LGIDIHSGTAVTRGLGTRLIHGGEQPDPITGAIAPPLIRTKTFRQPTFGEESKWQYSRGKNPTRSILERKLEALLGDGQATVFGSGDAATTMFLLTLQPGDHILLCAEVYGGTSRLVNQLFAGLGITADYIDFSDPVVVTAAIKPTTKYFWVESPTNPSLHITDLSAIEKLSQETGIPYVADLTFAPPCTTDPFAYGADTVIYSLSKYFAGHNDVIGGAVITRNAKLHERLCWLQWSVGAILSPDECYRVIQELKTLELRWQRVSATAQIIAEFLQERSDIQAVNYPGLPDHPGHDLAQRQMEAGFGGVLSFCLEETQKSNLARFVAAAQASGIIIFGESLASPESILAHPLTMSHRSVAPDVCEQLGIGQGFFRLSVGFEDPADIAKALSRGLDQIA